VCITSGRPLFQASLPRNIIDIQLTAEMLDSVDDGAPAIEGFKRIDGLADDCPPGLQLDKTELKKRFYRSGGRPANQHVRWTF
jgi:hypothetical protein